MGADLQAVRDPFVGQQKPWWRRAAIYAAGFVKEHTPQSSARLVGILMCLVGCIVALGTLKFAYLHPDRAGTVSALAATTAACFGPSFATIWSRSRTGEDG